MRNRKNLATGIIATALLATNITTGFQLHTSKEKLVGKQNEITKQYKSINSLIGATKALNVLSKKQQKDIEKLNKDISTKNTAMKFKDSKIISLEAQLKKANEMQVVAQKPSNSAKETKNQRVLDIKVTAFTSTCKGCSGITASGFNVKTTILYNGLRVVAMDTSVVPMYSLLRIETKRNTYNAIVLDRGGAIKGEKCDLLVSTYQDAINFGRQNAKVTVLREGKG